MPRTRQRLSIDVTGDPESVSEYVLALADHLRSSATGKLIEVRLAGGVLAPATAEVVDSVCAQPEQDFVNDENYPELTPAANARIVPPPQPRTYK